MRLMRGLRRRRQNKNKTDKVEFTPKGHKIWRHKTTPL